MKLLREAKPVLARVCQVVAALCGAWLMASPALFGYGGAAAVNDRICGPIIATFSCVAAWEVTRPVRWVSMAIAGWMIVGALVLDYNAGGAGNVVVTALVIIACSLVRGRAVTRFGGGWRSLWNPRQAQS